MCYPSADELRFRGFLRQDLAVPDLAPEVKAAFDVALANISAFHTAQRPAHEVDVETMPGVRCRRVARPIGTLSLL